MYDGEFGPAVNAIYAAAKRVQSEGPPAVRALRFAITLHQRVLEGFNKLHISGDEKRAALLIYCRSWMELTDEPGGSQLEADSMLARICDEAAWFAERYK